MRPGKHVFNVSSISSAATGFTLLLNWEVLGALMEAETIVELNGRSEEEEGQGAFSITVDRLVEGTATGVLEVIEEVVALEIESRRTNNSVMIPAN